VCGACMTCDGRGNCASTCNPPCTPPLRCTPNALNGGCSCQ
jgi:hypothetical protein